MSAAGAQVLVLDELPRCAVCGAQLHRGDGVELLDGTLLCLGDARTAFAGTAAGEEIEKAGRPAGSAP
jgi:hypothetical protein